MQKLKRLEPGTALFVWSFSNSGTGPDCSIDEIPNNALQFLFDVSGEMGSGGDYAACKEK